MLYLQSFNATKAYMQAYGGTYTTANTNGPALLVDTGVLMRTRTGDIRPVEYIRLPVDGKDISTIDGTEAPIEGFYIHYSSGKTARNHLVPTRKVIDYGKAE